VSPVVLASSSTQLRQRVQEATGGDSLVAETDGGLPRDPHQLLAQTGDGGGADVVLLDAGSAGTDRALALAARFDQDRPEVSVVLVGELEAEDWLAAMRAGVRDVLSPESTVAEIARVLDRASVLARERALALEEAARGPTGRSVGGRLIAVLSPRGGIGKTTVATNLAVGLALSSPGSTVLVDLDIQFGDVASGLDLDPEHGLSQAVRGRAVEDSMVLKTYLSEHRSGLYVLGGPRLPSEAEGISGAQVRRVLELLAAEFRYVVVDTASGFTDHTLAALDLATDLVLLTAMDVTALHGLRGELETLDELGMTAASRQVVVNLVERRSGLTIAEAEDILGARVDLLLPRHPEVVAATNQGLPLLQGKPKNPVARALHELVERYTPPKPTTVKAGRLKGRHAVKR
jgi:pilus assembly protein CpaE